MKNVEIMEELKELSNSYKTSELEKTVCNIVIDECNNEPISYIKDVLNHGCVSGCVSALIYYKDTKKFFTENMDDILYSYNEYCKEAGTALLKEIDSNNLAWFGFENTLLDIANTLEIDY